MQKQFPRLHSSDREVIDIITKMSYFPFLVLGTSMKQLLMTSLDDFGRWKKRGKNKQQQHGLFVPHVNRDTRNK